MKSALILGTASLSIAFLCLHFTLKAQCEVASCKPTGTFLNETTTGCPNPGSQPTTISKTTNWNINWPDGHAAGLTATGTGQCHNRWDCCDWAIGRTECWPGFN